MLQLIDNGDDVNLSIYNSFEHIKTNLDRITFDYCLQSKSIAKEKHEYLSEFPINKRDFKKPLFEKSIKKQIKSYIRFVESDLLKIKVNAKLSDAAITHLCSELVNVYYLESLSDFAFAVNKLIATQKMYGSSDFNVNTIMVAFNEHLELKAKHREANRHNVSKKEKLDMPKHLLDLLTHFNSNELTTKEVELKLLKGKIDDSAFLMKQGSFLAQRKINFLNDYKFFKDNIAIFESKKSGLPIPEPTFGYANFKYALYLPLFEMYVSINADFKNRKLFEAKKYIQKECEKFDFCDSHYKDDYHSFVSSLSGKELLSNENIFQKLAIILAKVECGKYVMSNSEVLESILEKIQ